MNQITTSFSITDVLINHIRMIRFCRTKTVLVKDDQSRSKQVKADQGRSK